MPGIHEGMKIGDVSVSLSAGHMKYRSTAIQKYKSFVRLNVDFIMKVILVIRPHFSVKLYLFVM